jgi:sugar phosphate isomerase/epimerase
MPTTGLVQLCDCVHGDRTTPCKCVPGDGVVPLEAIVTDLLELGYQGVFDIELVGQRVAEEGHRRAFARAAENLSEMLVRLGA